jgi:hypothetical protein
VLLQQLFLPAAIISWIGMGAVLFVRVVRKQHAYLRRLPFMEEVWLDMLATPPVSVQLAMIRAMFQRQDDPEVEQFRREVLRRFLRLIVWVTLYPFFCFGVWMLLVLSGLVQ